MSEYAVDSGAAFMRGILIAHSSSRAERKFLDGQRSGASVRSFCLEASEAGAEGTHSKLAIWEE